MFSFARPKGQAFVKIGAKISAFSPGDDDAY